MADKESESFEISDEEIAALYNFDPRIIKIADHYLYGPQSRQCIEECAELIQAICKHNRALLDKDDKEMEPFRKVTHVREEMADVHIMLDQMQYLLMISDEEMNLEIDRKLKRQLRRMEEEGEDS